MSQLVPHCFISNTVTNSNPSNGFQQIINNVVTNLNSSNDFDTIVLVCVCAGILLSTTIAYCLHL